MATRGRSTELGNVGNDTGQSKVAPAGATGNQPGGKRVKSSASQAPRTTPQSAINRLCARDDGWLRLSPDGNMNQVYLKFKFVKCSYAGSYVMVMCHWSEADWGLELLEEKINSVYAGTLRPVKDRYFQND